MATEENEDAPITNVSFNDAQQFVAWLAQETRMNFRLPTEAEWEYAARGGTHTKYWWGDDLQPGMVNCKGCNGDQNARQTSKVEDFKPNPFGLLRHGRKCSPVGGGLLAQELSGCRRRWIGLGDSNSCIFHVIRSGSWRNAPNDVRSASRDYYDGRIRYPTHGFRVARSL